MRISFAGHAVVRSTTHAGLIAQLPLVACFVLGNTGVLFPFSWFGVWYQSLLFFLSFKMLPFCARMATNCFLCQCYCDQICVLVPVASPHLFFSFAMKRTNVANGSVATVALIAN